MAMPSRHFALNAARHMMLLPASPRFLSSSMRILFHQRTIFGFGPLATAAIRE